ncbi:MAG: hypothetical protein GF350_05785 [Chitinivibrionales bacterium]|nr:hypothetical protein [Chitinivibrionales bacterium]
MDRHTRGLFEEYLNQRYKDAGAFTTGDKLEVVRTLLAEAREQGMVPVAQGQVLELDTQAPSFQAILEGKQVSLASDGAMERKSAAGGGVAGLSVGARLGIMGGFLVAIVVVMIILLRGCGGPEEEITPTASATAERADTPTSLPTPAPVTGTVRPTPTPYNISLALVGDASDEANAPASVELAGNTFVLAVGKVKDGLWEPEGPEWLQGTEVRRVLALPYSADLANSVTGMTPGEPIRLRLRSGEMVEYHVTGVERVQRHQIEVLAEMCPSIVIVLYGERTSERWVVIGDALQQPEDFVEYTPVAATPGGATTPAPTPTLAPGGPVQVEFTSATVITHATAGLVLGVNDCRRVERIGDVEPSESSEEFVVCDVVLKATAYERYSGASLVVTEHEWVTTSEGWWPEVVETTGRLGDGTLVPDGLVTGQVAGVVRQKPSIVMPGKSYRPVLVWEWQGMRYIVELSELLDEEEELPTPQD